MDVSKTTAAAAAAAATTAEPVKPVGMRQQVVQQLVSSSCMWLATLSVTASNC
jgi:hypothetical protein